MAHGIEFEGVNRHLGAPKTMTEEQCYTLPVKLAKDLDMIIEDKPYPCIISCWQFSPEEMEELNRNGGKTYMKVSGAQPPINITPFVELYTVDSSEYDICIKPQQVG